MDLPAPVDPSPKPPENMPETSMPPGPSQSTRSRGCAGREVRSDPPTDIGGLGRCCTSLLYCWRSRLGTSLLYCWRSRLAGMCQRRRTGSVLMRSRRDQRKPKNMWPASPTAASCRIRLVRRDEPPDDTLQGWIAANSFVI